ncbi:RagB/SusD family nutrient uptake outer membrane protein [Pseudarcicella hirudinis]|uniref:RagB/SusD family nutrient uptake outer membrane protein n=1 Tax=Pseudarcicella hirudinis TaxID=1079859 RepID=UPI0035F0D541
MKPIYKYLMGTALSLSFWACDIERTPYDGLTPDKVISTPDGINLAVAGNYSLLKAWSENWHRIEYPGDNVALSGTTTDNLFFIYNYRRIPNNSRVDAFWRSSYRIIVGVNQVLGATKEGTSADMDQQLGESYYLRGLMHFQMVCAFGKPYAQGRDNPGVPLKLDADALNYPTRSKVGEVYDQVEKDLLKAESLMKVEKTNVYVSKGAIWALLSRLYLYKEDNAKALEYANKVINSGKYSLLNTEQLPDYPKFAPENNSETIFAIKYVLNTDYANSDNGYSTVGSMYATINGSGWGELYASRPYLELIRKFPEDVRNKFISPLADSDFPDVTWAVYTVLSKGSYQYKETEVTKQGDDYVYQDNGTNA